MQGFIEDSAYNAVHASDRETRIPNRVASLVIELST